MTASKEIYGGESKAKKVIGTTLAGVLAVGMVPAAGIAAVSEEALADEGDLEMLADLVPADNFSQGEVTALSIAPGNASKVKKNAFKTDLSNGAIRLNGLTLESKDGVQVNPSNYDVTILNAAGNAVTTINEKGSYTIEVAAKSDSSYAGGKVSVMLSVGGIAISSVTPTAYNVAQTTDLSAPKTDFPYVGEAQTIGFVDSSNEALVEGVDYTVQYYVSGTTNKVDAADIVNPGSYYAILTGTGLYSGTHRTSAITVDQLQLSTDVTAASVSEDGNWIYGEEADLPNNPLSVTIGGHEYSSPTLMGMIQLKFADPTGATASDSVATVLGDLDVTLNPSDKVSVSSPEVATPKTIANGAHRAVKPVTFQYNGAAWPTDAVTVNQNAWNSSLVSVLDPDGNKLVEGTGYTLAWTSKNNGYTSAPTGTNYDEYYLTVTTAAVAGNEYGGTAKLTVNYVAGTIDCAKDLTVYYPDNQTNVEAVEATYVGPGTNIANNITTVLRFNGTTLTDGGSDYDVEFYDANGNKVTAIVDAGKYTMKVVSDSYVLTNNEVAVTVNPVDVAAFRIQPEQLSAINGQNGFPYVKDTPIDLKGALQYKLAPAKATDPYKMWDDPAGYTLVVKDAAGNQVDVDKIVDAGTYTVCAAPADASSPNYAVSAPVVEFKVIAESYFVDVPQGAWFYESVEKARLNGYMQGYDGSRLFGPYDQMTRAQMACVLYNMAGATNLDESIGGYDENRGWVSFDDVDGNMKYAKAVAWAKQAKVVNGFAGTNNFGPDEKITREQFACMLANYAKMVGNYAAVEDAGAVLAGMPDGDRVDGWARDGVAWAVQNKIMGNGGAIEPLALINRAEAAAMAVNYQPNKLATDVVDQGAYSVAVAGMEVGFTSAAVTETSKSVGTGASSVVNIPSDANGTDVTLTVDMAAEDETLVASGDAAAGSATYPGGPGTPARYVLTLDASAGEVVDDATIDFTVTSANGENTMDYTVTLKLVSVNTECTAAPAKLGASDVTPTSVSSGDITFDAIKAADLSNKSLVVTPTLPAGAEIVSVKPVTATANVDKYSDSYTATTVTLKAGAASVGDDPVVKFTVKSAYGNKVEYTLTVDIQS